MLHDMYVQQLELHHIDQYLRAYSPLVQSLLHVENSISEREYIIQQISYKSFFFGIFLAVNDALIGAIEIRNPSYRSQLYCWLNEQYWGKNYFAQALQEVASRYFQQSDEKQISARVDCKNQRSYRALLKLGFILERTAPGGYGPQYELVYRKQ